MTMKLEVGKIYARRGDPDARLVVEACSPEETSSHFPFKAGGSYYTSDGRYCTTDTNYFDLVEIPAQPINMTDKYQHAGFPGVLARIGFIDMPGDFPVFSTDLDGIQYHRHRADGTYGAPGHRFDLVPFVAPAPELLVFYANVYPSGIISMHHETASGAEAKRSRGGRTAKFVEVPE